MHSNLILVTTAALVMGAGVVVGRLSDRLPTPGLQAIQPPPPTTQGVRHGRSWFTDQLNLTTEQSAGMDEIWSETRQKMDKLFDTRRLAETQREDAIMALLSPEQRTAYEKINKDFQDKRDEMFKARDLLMQEANERSRALLDPGQQKKWDQLSKQMRDRRGPMGSGRGGGHRGPGMEGYPGRHDETTPTTKPAASADVDHA